jgi:hypothetical protein
MSEGARTNFAPLLPRRPSDSSSVCVHPAWLRLMRYCAELGHGEIEKLKIQDGLPMIAEVAVKKIKFDP